MAIGERIYLGKNGFEMKIGMAVDNTLGLHIPSFIDFVKRHSPIIECQALTSRFYLTSTEIEYRKAVKELNSEIKKEMVRHDLSLLITAIPFSNNYFYSGAGGIYIISLSSWNDLTTLPMSNGVAYMLCEILVDRMKIGIEHSENTGCVNDFLWDKKGIDVGMRAAYICDECRSKSRENPYIASPEFKGVVAMLDAISTASRRGADILLEPVMAPVQAATLATFMCHNSADKQLVRQLNDTLKNAKIKTWFDEDEIQPADVWQDVLEKAIVSIGSCLVIVGDSGFGPWQDMERRAFINEFANRGCKIIPVLIGSAAKVPELPLFLRQFMWVDLRANDNRQLARLIAALKPS
jgi:hypothetical protein